MLITRFITTENIVGGKAAYNVTFASGGYIINIKPIAIGTFVVPDWNEFIKPAVLGIKHPSKAVISK